MHSTTGITDQFCSNMNDEEKKVRIDSLFRNVVEDKKLKVGNEEFLEYIAWKKKRNQ